MVGSRRFVDVTGRPYPPFEDRMSQSRGSGCFDAYRTSFWGGSVLEELSGGNWMASGRSPLHGGRSTFQVGRCDFRGRPFLPVHNCFCPAALAVPSGASGRGIRPGGRPFLGGGTRYHNGSYLVDSASSHMLVSKIKPCMSKYKQSYCETANGSLNQLSFI